MHRNKPRVRYSEAGSPDLLLHFIAVGNEFWDSWVFELPGYHSLLESDNVNRLASRACFPKVVEDITEVDVLKEGGFIFKSNHPRFFHAGENKFLPNAIGNSNGHLAIKIAGPVLFLA